MKKILLVQLFILSIFLVGCETWGEYGEFSYELSDALEYSETINGVVTIDIVGCFTGLETVAYSRLNKYAWEMDAEGVCLILYTNTAGEQKLYSYGSPYNTHLLEIEVKHSLEDILLMLDEKEIEHVDYWLSMDITVSEDIFVTIDSTSYNILSDELMVCEYLGGECIPFNEYYQN